MVSSALYLMLNSTDNNNKVLISYKLHVKIIRMINKIFGSSFLQVKMGYPLNFIILNLSTFITLSRHLMRGNPKNSVNVKIIKIVISQHVT